VSVVCDTSRLNHTFILASAGSGKTYQLANRYLQLAAADAKPSTILAATFTRVAAGEIRDRILLRLARAAQDDDLCAGLAEELGVPGLGRDGVLELLARLARDLHQLQIRTLDSFFASVVRAFALELRVPPGSEIVDEDQAARMRTDAIGQLLGAGKVEELTELLRLLTRGASERSVVETIDRTVRDLFALYREADDRAWECVPPMRGRLPASKLRAAVEALGTCRIPGERRRLHRAWTADLDQARSGRWDEFIASGLAGSLARQKTTFGRTPLEPHVAAAYQPLVDHARAVLVERVRAQTIATRDLLRLYGEQYEAIKHRRRGLTFDDLAEAMSRAQRLGRLEEIWFRIDAQLRHLLLDEFQDTSLPQWRALEPIALQIVSNAPPDYSFFCVGDVKQSIYGWRDAAPEVLDELPRLLVGPDGTSAIEEAEALTTSYRSSQVVIDVVNDVFGALEANTALADSLDAVRLWQRGFARHETARQDLAGFAELRTAPRARDAKHRTIARLRTAAGLAADLHRRNAALRIAILTRTNDAVARLLFELGPSQRNLPASGRGGGPLTDSAAVNAVLDLLQLADHPDDTIAAFNVARGPLGEVIGMTDYGGPERRRATARQVRRRLLANGYAASISQWARRLVPACDGREARRLLQLIELAGRYDPRSTLRPGDFVRFVEHTQVADVKPAPVQVMTIHQAKGLEFDVVILPQLEASLTGASQPPVVFARQGETGPVEGICRFMNKEVLALVPQLEPLFARHRLRTVRESLCLLYVAMTRARHALHIVIDPPREKERSTPRTLAGVVRCALVPGSLEPGTQAFSRGDPDWLEDREALPAPPPAPPTPSTVRLAPSTGAVARAAASPSELPEQAAAGDVEAALSLPNRAARERGAAIHAMFQEIEWLDDWRADSKTLERLARRSAPRRGNAWARHQVDSFLAMLEHPAVRRILTRGRRDRAVLRLWRERPFARLVDGLVQRGAFDRLEAEFVGGQVRSATVIDFKTDTIEAIDAPAAARQYRPQLEAYRAAAAEMLGADAAVVRMVVLFASCGEAVTLGPVDPP
jgi:ATP-dependent exoDNAse (exonuclease V) beta subunit